MTKSHNQQLRDDETRYVRYAPCLCFRFLQTCQCVTYVLLLACVIYFFSITSWYPSTSSTSATPEKHPHLAYRPKPNGFRSSGLRVKQSQGYHRSMFHNKRILFGTGLKPWMRKKMKSKVSPFTFDDVPALSKKNLMAQDRKSDNNRKVFPLESGRHYKYAGADRKALDIIQLMSTKSPKSLTGPPSQTRLVPLTKTANRGKAFTIEERIRWSTQGPTGREGPRRPKSHVHLEGTKLPGALVKSKSNNTQFGTEKLSGIQSIIAMKLPIVAKDDTVTKKGAKGKNAVASQKIQMKKMRVEKLTSKRSKGKSEKEVFSGQPRVHLKKLRERRVNHKEIQPFPSQRNLRKFDLLHDTKVIPKTLKYFTSTGGSPNGGSASSVETRMHKLKLRGPPERSLGPRGPDGIKPQQNRSRILNGNKTDTGLLKETQQVDNPSLRPHSVGKLDTVDKGLFGRRGNSSRLVNEGKFHGAKDNGVLSKIYVHKKILPIPKYENTTHDRTKQQERPADPRHVVRRKGHSVQQGHGGVPPHNKELRQADERGRQVMRGEGHKVARSHNDVRPRDDVRRRAVVLGHGGVRGQGHDSAQGHAGVRGRDKVRSQERVRGHASTRVQDSERGNTIGKDHLGGQFGARGHVTLRGHKDSRGHAGQRGHTNALSQGHAGTKIDQRQQAKTERNKSTIGTKRNQILIDQ